MNDAPPVIPQSPVAPGTKKLHEMARANWLVAGAERRQPVAHGVSRGYPVANNTSPVGARGPGRIFSTFVRRVPIEWTLSVAPSGLGWFYSPDPRLSPWAIILRHSVAYK